MCQFVDWLNQDAPWIYTRNERLKYIEAFFVLIQLLRRVFFVVWLVIQKKKRQTRKKSFEICPLNGIIFLSVKYYIYFDEKTAAFICPYWRTLTSNSELIYIFLQHKNIRMWVHWHSYERITHFRDSTYLERFFWFIL